MLLKELLKENNITQLDIANELGIRSLSTVNQKLINKSEFTKIYEQKKKPSTGKIPQSTSTANNIPQNGTNVKSSSSTIV